MSFSKCIKEAQMNAYNLLCGALFISPGKFSDYWDFVEFFFEDFKELEYDDIEIIKKKLLNLIKDLEISGKVKTPEQAFQKLAARDLNKVFNSLDKMPSSTEMTTRLKNGFSFAVKYLHELGINFPAPDFYIVSEFPKPYNNMDWVAFAPDKADQESYKISAGVYLLEKELAPNYSEPILAHEIVHTAIGKKKPNLLGRGLEEGVAELLGNLAIGSRIVGPEVAQNQFIFSHMGSHYYQTLQINVDYFRQVAAIYQKFGIEGIAQLVIDGREKIKEVEKLCLTGNFSKIKLPSGIWDDQLSEIVCFLSSCFVPNLVVSPLAAYVAEFIQPGLTVTDISNSSRVEHNLVVKAIEEIQNRTFTILVDNNQVAYSDLDFILSTNSFRYEVLK